MMSLLNHCHGEKKCMKMNNFINPASMLRFACIVIMLFGFKATFTDAQTVKTISVNQYVKDSFTKVGIPNAKVTLLDETRTVIDTMRTRGSNGYWDRELERTPRKYIVRVEHPDYETGEMSVELRNLHRNRYLELSTLLMKRRFVLDEVVVTASIVKIAYKGDTIEVNANAFNIPEGSMLSGLVGSIPGCELKSGGEILMNGRRVDYLLLNGKEFFRGDNSVMLDNLPYYVVQKLQFYEKEDEEKHASTLQKDYVMDVTLKRDYQTGLVGNAELAGGTSDRWLARTFNLRFTNNSRLCVFGNANNVNQTNKPSNGGNWTATTQTGELTTRRIGIDVEVDDKDGRFNEHAEGTVRWDKSEDEMRSATESYLASGTAFGRKHDFTAGRNKQIDLRNKFQVGALTLNSEWNHHRNDGTAMRRSAQFAASPSSFGTTTVILDSLLQASTSSAISRIAINSMSNQMETNGTEWTLGQKVNWQKYTKWGDDYALDFDGSVGNTNRDNTNLYRLSFYQSPIRQERRDQYREHNERRYRYAIGGAYRFHLLSGIHFGSSYHYQQSYNSTRSNLFKASWDISELPSVTDFKRQQDFANSYTSRHYARKHEAIPYMAYLKGQGLDQLTVSLEVKISHLNEREYYQRGEIDADVSRNYLLIEPNLHFYRTKGKWSWTANYTLRRDVPDIIKTIGYSDTSDPLRKELGNSGLKPSDKHAIRLSITRSLNDYSQNISLMQSVNVMNRLIAESVAYDAGTGVYTYKPENVNGNWNSQTQLNVRKAIDRQKRLFVNSTTRFSYFRNADLAMLEGYTNSILNKVNNCLTEQDLNMEYQKGKLFIALTGNIAWDKVSRDGDDEYDVSAWNYSYGLSCRYSLPWEIKLSTNLKMYSRRGYEDHLLNSNDIVWNATISKSFFNGRFVAQIEGYDLLHQLSNVSYIVNAQGRTETWHHSLPHYVMAHLAYHWNKNPKRK